MLEKTHWQNDLVEAITCPEALLSHLELNKNLLPAAKKATLAFPLKVTHSFLNRIKKGNPTDPLLLQVLPLNAELHVNPEYTNDPLHEKNFNPIPGLLHKYKNRVLLTLTQVCAINCRFCFRRHFPYEDNNPGSVGWLNALDYIRERTQISEVILSGGDPLVASDTTLQKLIQELGQIQHVKRLRIHTRLPIVLPNRITPELVTLLTETSLKVILVTHCNHAQELNEEVSMAIQRLKEAKVTLLNQTVILKGINDNASTLIELSEQLFAIGILPYYLHLLDKVAGAAHFDIPIQQVKTIYQTMRENLSGYLLPRLVYEKPHEAAKTPIF